MATSVHRHFMGNAQTIKWGGEAGCTRGVAEAKRGIRDDLYRQSVISHRRITAPLRSYCNRVQYLKATMEGAVRIDLAGKPAGTVTAVEAEHAKQKLV
jgi:ProP effector